MMVALVLDEVEEPTLVSAETEELGPVPSRRLLVIDVEPAGGIELEKDKGL